MSDTSFNGLEYHDKDDRIYENEFCMCEKSSIKNNLTGIYVLSIVEPMFAYSYLYASQYNNQTLILSSIAFEKTARLLRAYAYMVYILHLNVQDQLDVVRTMDCSRRTQLNYFSYISKTRRSILSESIDFLFIFTIVIDVRGALP